MSRAIGSEHRFVIFRLGRAECALALADIREIVALPALSTPPGIPPLIAGFLNLEGVAIPVIRIDHLFGLPETEPGVYTPVIILKAGDPPLALLVDRIVQAVTVEAGAMVPVREAHTFNDCAVGEIAVAGKATSVLSVERLLLEKEQQSVAEFQVMEQRRLREIERARE